MYFKVQKARRHKLFGSRGSQEYHEKDNSYRILSLCCRNLWEGAPLGTSASLSKRWVLPRIQALQPLMWYACYIWTSLEPNINIPWCADCKGQCSGCFCPERHQRIPLSCTQQCPKNECWERNMKGYRHMVIFHQYAHPFCSDPCCRGSLWLLCRVRSTSPLHRVLYLRFSWPVCFRMRLIKPSLAYFSPSVVKGIKMIGSDVIWLDVTIHCA